MNYYGKTHAGLKRKNNQDSICIVEQSSETLLAIVCDGIGGGNAGDIASSMAVHHMENRFLKADINMKNDREVKNFLKTTIQEANDIILMQANRNEKQKGMGTTMVGFLKSSDATYVFNVGDSRTYGLYKDDFISLTEDHSYVADLLKRGEVSEEEARVHPNRNVLTNALGIWKDVKIDINKIADTYISLLVCSDGLHGYVSEDSIRFTLECDCDVQAKVDLLIQAALQAGGYDNVSVIIYERIGEAHE